MPSSACISPRWLIRPSHCANQPCRPCAPLQTDRGSVQLHRRYSAGAGSLQLLATFTANAVGPALLLRHFSPLLDRQRALLVMLSAKVGSIGDNRLGGWYSYRASKAALNQLVRTAAIELARQKPQAICVALHPGTVDTRLSSRFTKSGLEVQSPDEAATRLLAVIDGLGAKDSGGFFNHHGEPLPW